MSIRYTPEYNKKIRDAVRHARNVERTLSRRGIKLGLHLPTTSELKSKYQTRRGLNKELTLLNKLSSSSDSVLKKVENQGGASAIKWELDYLKQNVKNAIEYYEWEKKLELEKNPKYPHEMARIYEIDENLTFLQSEVDYMNQEQFKGFKGAINEYTKMVEHMQKGYRGFLYQVENAMRYSGFSEEEINHLFKELKTLTPSEFHEWYRKNDNVKRIYEMVPSPQTTDNKLNTTIDNARIIIGDLLSTVKQEIAEIKSK